MSSRAVVFFLLFSAFCFSGVLRAGAGETPDRQLMPAFVRINPAPEMFLVDVRRDVLAARNSYADQEYIEEYSQDDSFEDASGGITRDTDDGLWAVIRGDKVSLYYLPGASLARIESRLGTRRLPLSPHYRRLFTSRDYPIENRISARLQFLMMRVEDILGMKPFIPQLKIELYRTRQEMQGAYVRQGGAWIDARSFYVHKHALVFSSEQDLIDSIIAHEMAHAVIDHYFKAPPPVQVAELLAAHVDEHLEGP